MKARGARPSLTMKNYTLNINLHNKSGETERVAITLYATRKELVKAKARALPHTRIASGPIRNELRHCCEFSSRRFLCPGTAIGEGAGPAWRRWRGPLRMPMPYSRCHRGFARTRTGRASLQPGTGAGDNRYRTTVPGVLRHLGARGLGNLRRATQTPDGSDAHRDASRRALESRSEGDVSRGPLFAGKQYQYSVPEGARGGDGRIRGAPTDLQKS